MRRAQSSGGQPKTPGHLRSPTSTAFLPQFAPNKEAPYIMASSAPGMPHAAAAWSAEVQRDRIMDVERTYRRRKHCEDAFKDRDKLDKTTVLQKAQIQKAMTQEHLDVKNRMKIDKAKREQRWTKKTASSPFGVDLWDEDLKLYNAHTMNNANKTSRQRTTAKAMLQDQSNRRETAVNEIDTLGNLRKEKKQLQLDQRELKARLDLDKVEKRCAAAQLKADTIADEHQEMLAGKGHLDRAHSDFFTEPRLSAAEREQLREKAYQWEPQEVVFRGTSSWSLAGQFEASQPADSGDLLPPDMVLKESEPPAEMPDFTDAGESVESPAERASTKDEEPAESELSVGNQLPFVKAESELSLWQ